MGRCHEFGSQIREGCSHPMRAGERACACPECGVVCQGQFDGCPGVWARGPRPVTFTSTAAIAAPRVRALAAGPEPALAAAAPPPSPAPPPNGSAARASNGNGYSAPSSSPPPPPPPPPPPRQGAGSRTEVLQWFEEAFDELRNELHAVASTVARQQAMLAELLDSRDAEMRVVLVAESLPELAGEAASKALADQSDGLAETVAAALDDLRASMESADLSNVAVMDSMRELLRRVEVTAEINTAAARDEGAARLEALKASVARQLRPLSAAVAEVAGHIEAAEEREAARTRALKASVTRQLQPLAASVEAVAERSDRQLAEITARLDALAAPRRPTAAPKAAPKATSKVASKKAEPGKVAAVKPRAVARKRPPAEPETATLYDYKTPAAPAPPLLLRRRQAKG